MSFVSENLCEFNNKSNVVYTFVTNSIVDEKLRQPFFKNIEKKENVETEYYIKDIEELINEYRRVVSKTDSVPKEVSLPIQHVSNKSIFLPLL